MHFSTLISAAAFTSTALAGYALQDDYMSKDFYSEFDFFTAPDPTHGFVKYVDQAKAKSMGLLNTTAKASWGVDTKNKDAGGRASVRLTSKKSYNHALVVIDVGHMPFGCGTWPAFWMVGPDWPNKGEIDILEGVNEQATNAITLHTNAGCSVGDTSAFNGKVKTKNCDVKASGQDENAGCGVEQSDPKSYGAGLNNNGGGVFATEWTSDFIQVFWWPKGSVPKDALGDAPNPSGWGKPAAKWAKSGCDIDSHFKNQQLVFDTTFCGDWAGNTWSTSSCKSKAATCNAFVQNNPQAFTNAYWKINALKVYSNKGGAAAPAKPASSSAAKPSSAAGKPASSGAAKPSSAAGKPASSAAGKPASSGASKPASSAKASSIKAAGGAANAGLATAKAVSTSSKAALSGTGKGEMGLGFSKPTGTGVSASSKAKTTVNPSKGAKPFPAAGNSTMAHHPSGSGRPSGSKKPATLGHGPMRPSGSAGSSVAKASGSAKVSGWSPGNSFSVDLPKTTKAAVNAAPTANEGEEIVTKTVVQTVVVTMGGPKPTGAGDAHKRHASLHRRRQGLHGHHHA